MRLNRSVCQNPVSLFTIIRYELSQKNRKNNNNDLI